MDADLVFPHDYRSDGFTTNVTSRQAAEPDPVVRELLQNSLDAAIREAGRERAEVHFTIARRSLSDLPGLAAYRKAFSAARKEREADSAAKTHDQQSAIKRIQDALDLTEMSVLFCRDNGVGLDLRRLQALLSEGNSNKAGGGAGSYGLGHLTAYAASDLRYVLYAGRQAGGDIASGHAILASHRVGRARYAADGYWRRTNEVLTYTVDDGNYPDEAPPLLQSEMDRIDSSGTVIAIAGFNHFHDDDPASAFDDICRVAAVNFLAAIVGGQMVVHVHDEQSEKHKEVNGDSVAEVLDRISGQQRLPGGMSGWLVGSQAYRALETLQAGRMLERSVDRSVEVRFRVLEEQSNERSRVQVFRDGMWITNDAPELRTGDFTGVKPFDAVVLLRDADPDDHGEVYDLVRNAEGPEHRGLTKLRELTKPQRDQLRGTLRQIADVLREEAGQIEHQDSYTPAGFAVFNADDVRDATPVPRIRYRPTGGYQTGTDPANQVAEDPPTPEEPGPGIPSERHTRRAPAPGRAVRLKRSVVPLESVNGEVRRLAAAVEIGEEAAKRDRYELRVFAESGSDESCEQPLQPQWLSIRSVTVDGQEINAGGKLEVAIPKTARSLIINLKDAVPTTATLELDIVRRRTAAGSGE